MPARDPSAAASARRLGPWSILLFVAGAILLTIATVLDSLAAMIISALLLGTGGLLLFLTALKGGRGDAPRVQ